MNAFYPSLIAVGVTLVPVLLAAGILYLSREREARRRRRSPLTSEILRPPGYSLDEKTRDLSLDLVIYLLSAVWAPPMLLSMYLLIRVFTPEADTPLIWVMLALTAVGILVFTMVRMLRIASVLRRYRDGLAGERATAQLLEPIIANGGRVLHDIEGDGFNVDHVVVAPGGVFAIETKHRLKPTTGPRNENAKVRSDGEALRFPDWTDTASMRQAAAEARWLTERLTRATALQVSVRPVVALPGWYVERTAPGGVLAINPKNCLFMLKPKPGEQALSAKHIQRIAYQLQQMSRLPDPDGRGNNKRDT
ncbi:MAG: NERD domain-containing protein [Thiohalocapsa sp.]|nr:NERD domain-containing protein [Thiohalocapsa sp.]